MVTYVSHHLLQCQYLGLEAAAPPAVEGDKVQESSREDFLLLVLFHVEAAVALAQLLALLVHEQAKVGKFGRCPLERLVQLDVFRGRNEPFLCLMSVDMSLVRSRQRVDCGSGVRLRG